jgi:tripartite-type tricarboxylate transporter receptor subunit TctC
MVEENEMNMGTRVVFRLGVIALALAAVGAALAQGSYPNRPVRIVVGFAPRSLP